MLLPTGEPGRFVAGVIKDVDFTDVEVLSPDMWPEHRWHAHERVVGRLMDDTRGDKL